MRILARSSVAAMTIALFVVHSTAARADATAFQSHCAKCHERVKPLALKLKGDSREERSVALAKFLETHHAEDAQVRAAIVDYLVDLPAR